MKAADAIVVGSPLYRHNICGSVRNVLDRFYGRVETGKLSDRKLAFAFRGAAPEKWMLEKKPWIVLIPGSRKPERLHENLGAVNVTLSADEVSRIDALLDQLDLKVFGGHQVK